MINLSLYKQPIDQKPTNKMPTFSISLHAPPGAGKSYLLRQLQTYFMTKPVTKSNVRLYYVQEPVQLFQTLETHNIFSLMESDPHRYATSVQQYITTILEKAYSEVLESLDHTKTNILLTDRYYDSSLCFSIALQNKNFVTSFDTQVLHHRVTEMEKRFNIKSLIHFYLATPIAICRKRIEQRERVGEASYTTIPYLNLVRDSHAIYAQQRSIVYTHIVSLDDALVHIMRILNKF